MPRTAVGNLMTEHRLIQRAAANMKEHAEEMRASRRLDPDYIDTIVDFFRTYADERHHGKEERIMFAKLEEKQMAPEHARMMEELIEGHRFARAKTREMEDARRGYLEGREEALAEAREAMEALADFYPKHIEVEDHQFFRPALQYFTKEERAEMDEEFAEFDRAMLHEKYTAILERLEAKQPAML